MEKVTANIVKKVTKSEEKALEILSEKKELNQVFKMNSFFYSSTARLKFFLI
jgi:hypothetical protein